VRRGARGALGVGAALIAMAAVSGASADVVSIDGDECSTSCAPSTPDDEAAAEAESTGDVTLSLFRGGQTGDASGVRPNLIFDLDAVPSVLVSGPPSPIVSLAAQAFDSASVSPYAFFETIIDIPLSADARSGIAGPPLSLFAPSLIGRATLTEFLSDSSEIFKQPALPPIHPAM
jgi:hypothetical protein